MLNIVYKILPSNFDYAIQEEMYTKLPNNLREVLGGNNNRKRMMSLLGWELLRENLPDPNLLSKIKFGDKGKPYITNSDIHFNISNTKGVVIVVVSDSPVGIDIETVRSNKESIYQKVFCQNEINFIKSNKDFTQLWTRKEAVVKLFGGGISMGLTSFSVLENNIVAFDKEIVIQEVEVPGYICHLAAYKNESPAQRAGQTT